MCLRVEQPVCEDWAVPDRAVCCNPPRSPLPLQVREEAAAVATACGGELSATAIAGDGALRAAAATAGQLVVTTPAKAAQALREGVLTPRMLEERLQVGLGDSLTA